MSDPHWQSDPAWVLEQTGWARRFAGASDLLTLLDVAEVRVRSFAKAGLPAAWSDAPHRQRQKRMFAADALCGRPTFWRCPRS